MTTRGNALTERLTPFMHQYAGLLITSGGQGGEGAACKVLTGTNNGQALETCFLCFDVQQQPRLATLWPHGTRGAGTG